MNKYKGLPLYFLDIDEEDNKIVDMVSIVRYPAIEKDFIAFSKNDNHLKFSLNDERREILGVAMLPDTPIYRKSNEGEEYFVQFTKDTIRKIAQTFFKKNFNNQVNIEHTEKMADAYIFQSFITDRKQGIVAPSTLGELPEGSWIVSMKVNSDDLWNSIKSGEKNGFSIEGSFYFFEDPVKYSNSQKHNKEEQELLNLVNELAEALNKIN